LAGVPPHTGQLVRRFIVASAYVCVACAPLTRPNRTASRVRNSQIIEISGVTRDGNRLLLVSDESTHAYYAYALQPAELPHGAGPVLSSFTIEQGRLTAHRIFASAPLDLEGIALLDPSHPIMVSETLRSLLSADRVFAQYPSKLGEIGNRGIEGLAARRVSDTMVEIAVLWEGGFLERRDLARQLTTVTTLLDIALKPVICVHTVSLPTSQSSEIAHPCGADADLIELHVPLPPDPPDPGEAPQRFRAPDLVWLPDGSGFLVLLASQNATTVPNPAYRYKWLQRFDRKGNAVGLPINLCSLLPASVRAGPSGNVEGLAWFDQGESVVLVNDFRGPSTAVILSITNLPPPSLTDICK
jgi:hypothetical protein